MDETRGTVLELDGKNDRVEIGNAATSIPPAPIATAPSPLVPRQSRRARWQKG